jgi:hypothetical protein
VSKGRHDRKGKESFEPWVKLDYIMTESAAWTSLSLAAIWVYIELRKTFNLIEGGNEHLILPYAKITWRLSRHTIAKAFRELMEFGFIRKVSCGGPQKNPNVFALSERWRERSQEIVGQRGKAAIQLRLAPKGTTSRIKNLEGHRTWEN